MFLRDLDDVRHFFASLTGSFSGVGMTAYSRIIPASLLQPYHIIALRKTRDLSLLRKRANIFCLEEETGHFSEEKGFNSARLLSHPFIKKFLKKLPDPKYLLLYQSYPELEELAGKEEYRLLANPSSVRMQVAERAFFLKMMDHLNLERIPGEIYPIETLYAYDYRYWAGKIAPRFVVHLTEILQGGGRGTFFVHTGEEYQRLQDRLKGATWQGKKISTMSVHQFIDGIPVSLALCLTRNGILFSALQRQLVDLPYCKDISENGIFCGHSWGNSSWPSHIHNRAMGQARLIGEYLTGLGYRGILGIDFLITNDKKHVYPLECNPRFTGAFPMLSQLHLANNIIPMDVFHILEFLDVPYEIDPVSLNSGYAETIQGSHILLFRREGEIAESTGLPEAGLYEFDPDTEMMVFLEGATDYKEIRNERQFIVIDGPPDTGGKWSSIQDPHHRICRVLFPYPVIDHEENLSARALFVVDRIYDRIFS